MMRWHMPPESSNGYCRARLAGSGMPTRAMIAMASFRAAARDSPRCSSKASSTCSPTRISGFSEATGSWKMIAASLPRTSDSSASESPVSSRPPSRIEPPEIRAAPGSRPSTESAVRLLPQPDSPTIARMRPVSTPSETPSTMRLLSISMARPSIASIGLVRSLIQMPPRPRPRGWSDAPCRGSSHPPPASRPKARRNSRGRACPRRSRPGRRLRSVRRHPARPARRP